MQYELRRNYSGLDRLSRPLVVPVRVRGENYALQGWRKNRIYPDFLVSVDSRDDGEALDLVAADSMGKHLDNAESTARDFID